MQSGGNLAEMIKQLEADRRRHAEAIEAIDQVLAQVGRAVGMPRMDAGEFTPSLQSLISAAPEVRPRGKFEQTGERSVLQFIAHRANPTTAEINNHWRAEGRRGVANVILLKLLKQGLIQRQMDPAIRGSRYLVTALGEEECQGSASETNVDSMTSLSRRIGPHLPAEQLRSGSNRLS
jgi:hypothetical protein